MQQGCRMGAGGVKGYRIGTEGAGGMKGCRMGARSTGGCEGVQDGCREGYGGTKWCRMEGCKGGIQLDMKCMEGHREVRDGCWRM